jgi:protein-S-isoprenylcysteine O-methyltransferase Ste14
VDLPFFWAYIAVFAAGFVAGIAVVWKTDPSLFQERLKPGPGGKDPHLRALAMLFFIGHWVVAGLDVGRYGWSAVPRSVQVLGAVGLAASLAMSCWAMSANRFFSSDARIQRDRGHYVVTGGPYRFIRHPGYAATFVMGLSSPLALGSYVSAVFVLPMAALIVRRLLLEERLLRAELEGYTAYAQRVQFRLFPGLW